MTDEIRAAIQRLAQSPQSNMVQVITATVTEVQWDGRTCTCKDDDGVEYYNVRLRALADNSVNGFTCRPKVNSQVLIACIEQTSNERYIAQYSDVEEIEIKGDSDIQITINNGNNNGLVKVAEVVKKLNALENDLNTIKTAFTAWVPVPQDGGAALKTAAAAWAAQQLTNTQQSDLENTKVKH